MIMKSLFSKMPRKWLFLSVIGAAVILIFACSKNGEMSNDTVGVESGSMDTVNVEGNRIEIETEYVTLSYPAEFEGLLTHREVVQDEVALEVFMGMIGESEYEIFRIYFNDATQGAVVGYIVHGEEEIPVSYYVSTYDEELTTENAKKDYYVMMDVFEAVMNSIYAAPQYTAERYEEPVGTSEAILKYWEVEIPENVYWEETDNELGYRVNFYGIVNDRRVDLYTIGWGEMESHYSLGTIMIDDVERDIQVYIYDLPEENDWDDVDYNSVYRMLESVNVVTDAIMAGNAYG